jgi:hypothetical protein
MGTMANGLGGMLVISLDAQAISNRTRVKVSVPHQAATHTIG